jgi:hypothetical protein
MTTPGVLGYVCCFCGSVVDPMPPDVGQLAFSMRYQEGKSEQKDYFYCHFACFLELLHPPMNNCLLESRKESTELIEGSDGL